MNLHMLIDEYNKGCRAFHRKAPDVNTLKGKYYEDSDSKVLQRFLLQKES